MFKGSSFSIGVAALGAIAASGLAIAPANAQLVFGSSGSFTNTGIVPNNYSGDGNPIFWGDPLTSAGQSGYRFDGIDNGTLLPIGNQFALGTFTHINNPVVGPSLDMADLSIALTGDLAGLNMLTASLDHTETPNIGGPVDDLVTITDVMPSPQLFSAGGIDYELQILGFGIFDEESGEFDIFDDLMFETAEGGNNSAQLVAIIEQREGQQPQEPVSVPEPGAVISLLAVGGLGLGLKRKKQG